MTIESELKRIADALEARLAITQGHPNPPPPVAQPDPEVAEKKKPGRKPKAAEASEKTEAEPITSITKEQLRAALQNLPDRETGLEILAKFKAPTLSALKESDYAAVMLMIEQVQDDE